MLLWKRKQAAVNQEFGDPDIIYIVELKVCCESSPEQTYQRAVDQHANLRRAICKQHPAAVVHTVVILVGVAGTAYEDYTLAPLRRLGISGKHLKQTIQKLAIAPHNTCKRSGNIDRNSNSRAHPQPREQASGSSIYVHLPVL